MIQRPFEVVWLFNLMGKDTGGNEKRIKVPIPDTEGKLKYYKKLGWRVTKRITFEVVK